MIIYENSPVLVPQTRPLYPIFLWAFKKNIYIIVVYVFVLFQLFLTTDVCFWIKGLSSFLCGFLNAAYSKPVKGFSNPNPSSLELSLKGTTVHHCLFVAQWTLKRCIRVIPGSHSMLRTI